MKLTRTGMWVTAASVVLIALGVRWRYAELVVVGLIGVLAVATAWLTVRSPRHLEILSRTLPKRVPRQSSAACRLRVANTGRRPLAPFVLVDRFLGATAEVAVAALAGGQRQAFDYVLAAGRRGVHPVGPLHVRRQDLLGLVCCERTLGVLGELTVHPVVFGLDGSHGIDHLAEVESLLRRTSADPMAGFQSLRDYQHGDDTRTIHWPSTARLGHLMVREQIDPRRPRLIVILDTSTGSYEGDDFEDAVDIAASVCAHGLDGGLQVVLRTNDPAMSGSAGPLAGREEMLDFLARVEPGDGRRLDYAVLADTAAAGTEVLIVSGATGDLPSHLPLTEAVRVVRIGAVRPAPPRLIPALGAPDFGRAWSEANW